MEKTRIRIDIETNILYDLCVCTELKCAGEKTEEESDGPENHDNHCGYGSCTTPSQLKRVS